MVSVDGGQLPFTTVQANRLGPVLRPLMAELADPGADTNALPWTTIQLPFPEVGCMAVSVPLAAHTERSFPAKAGLGRSSTHSCMVELLTGQAPLPMLQVSTWLPGLKLLTGLAGRPGDETRSWPDTTDQVPVPTEGVLPPRSTLALMQTVWPGPALAGVGEAVTATETVLLYRALPQALP